MKIRCIIGLLCLPFLISAQSTQPIPKGYVKVPAGKDPVREPAFYVMAEPVSAAEFRAFLDWLTPINRVEANRCIGAIPKDIPANPNYVLVADAFPAHRYADYVCEKNNVMKQKFTCRIPSTSDWKRMKGPDDLQLKEEKNRYGIRFHSGVYEWKTNKKGMDETFTDVNGYVRSGFRMILQPVVEKPTQTPAKK